METVFASSASTLEAQGKRIIIVDPELLDDILEQLQTLDDIHYLRELLACFLLRHDLKDFQISPTVWSFCIGNRTRNEIQVEAIEMEAGSGEMDTQDLLQQVITEDSLWYPVDCDHDSANADKYCPCLSHICFENVVTRHVYGFFVKGDVKSKRLDDYPDSYRDVARKQIESFSDARIEDARKEPSVCPLKRPAPSQLPAPSQAWQSCEAEYALMRHMVNLQSEWVLDHGTLKHDDLESLFGTNQLTEALLEHYITLACHDMEERLWARAEIGLTKRELDFKLTIYDARTMATIEKAGVKGAKQLWPEPTVAYPWNEIDVLVCKTCDTCSNRSQTQYGLMVINYTN